MSEQLQLSFEAGPEPVPHDPWAKWPIDVAPADPRVIAAVRKSVDDAYRASNRGAGIFREAMRLWWLTLDRYRLGAEEEYLEIVERIGPDATRALAPGFAALREHFFDTGGFADVLGIVYQEVSSNWGRSALGQFFTPWPIAMMLARLTIQGEGGFEALKNGDIVKVCDPACGSAVMLLAARAVVASELGRSASSRVKCYGQDLDEVCTLMAKIQLRFADERYMRNLFMTLAFELKEKSG